MNHFSPQKKTESTDRNNMPQLESRRARAWNFVAHNNAVPILLGIVFLGGTSAFAATPAGREALVKSTETIISVDNSYINSLKLETYDFKPRIIDVKEDPLAFYVTYTIQDIRIEDNVWQPLDMQNTMTISKIVLGDKDLGLYVADELQELIDYRKSFLAEVKSKEDKKGVTKKVATVAYSGLVGRFFNSKEKVFDGYKPVIPVSKPSKPGPYVEPDHATSTEDILLSDDERLRALVKEMLEKILREAADDANDTGTTTPPHDTPPDPGPDDNPVDPPPPAQVPPSDTPPADPPPADPPAVNPPPADSPVNDPPSDTPAPDSSGDTPAPPPADSGATTE